MSGQVPFTLDPGALTPDQEQALTAVLQAGDNFRAAFGRAPDASFLAELLVARVLSLELLIGSNTPGYDALDAAGRRYQIKYRRAQNIDVNNFEFDYLVLVELNDAFAVQGIWRMLQVVAVPHFTWREKFRKYQITSVKFKRLAERLV